MGTEANAGEHAPVRRDRPVAHIRADSDQGPTLRSLSAAASETGRDMEDLYTECFE
jgi:hypothetical protein